MSGPVRAADGAARLLGLRPRRAEAVHGGDLSEVVRLHLPDGATAIAKTGPAPRAEAEMLRALAAAGAPVPKVLCADDTVLVLSDVAAAGGLSDAGWADLGGALRRLHARTGPAYGWPRDYAFGPVPIRNAARADWPDFWIANRLLFDPGALPVDLRRRLERLAGRCADALPRHPPASLLHGDLWSGNLLARHGRLAGLIDPACYHGHAEVDLAMLTLFGRPGQGFWDAYGRPGPGWEARRAIYQLWPALVHLRLFGAGYRALVDGLLERAG